MTSPDAARCTNPIPFTRVNFVSPLPRIPRHPVLASLGSCFAESVMQTLLGSGCHGMSNPNGIVYNPFSMNAAIQHLDFAYSSDDFFEYEGVFHSFAHHGSFSASTLDEALNRAETSRVHFLRTVKKADAVILTSSSALVYYHTQTKTVTANCHKLPGNLFERRLLPVETCRAALFCACRKIRELNAAVPIFFTLSPVRHYPGDLVLNARSKANLLSAIHTTVEHVENSCYFPAYEIVTDELRDYRFYADDMLHPGDTAVRIVLERFLDTCFVEEARLDYARALEKGRHERHTTNQTET